MKFVIFVFCRDSERRIVERMTVPITTIACLFTPFAIKHQMFQQHGVRVVSVSVAMFGSPALVRMRSDLRVVAHRNAQFRV